MGTCLILFPSPRDLTAWLCEWTDTAWRVVVFLLARAAEVQAPALYRLLRTLASFGVFAETQDKRFKLTPLAATLQKGVPGSIRAVALHQHVGDL